ncbi:MAG: DUF3524 domain-containing protein [Bacteroidota bacterium]
MIYLLNPHHSGSHSAWANGLASHMQDEIQLFTLPGRHWKWRMHGAATYFAELLNERPVPQLILTTDMLDLASFRGLYQHRVPTLLYMHENQLTYPWSDSDADPALGRDRHYAWINISSALAADSIAFNSEYHRSAFLLAIPNYLKQLPDYTPKNVPSRIESKSHIVSVGLDLPSLLSQIPATDPSKASKPPVLLWNHRWEYDKGPDDFLQLCRILSNRQFDFQLIILGESGRAHPRAFDDLEKEFRDRIIHFGYAKDRDEYWSLLQRATIQPVTSRQDFFGISIVEAQWAGVMPLLPNRLVFRERAAGLPLLYDDLEEFVQLVIDPPKISRSTLQQIASRYNWPNVIDSYRKWFAKSA